VAKTIKVDGDRWTPRLSEQPPREGVNAVVFFCVSTHQQRPYRVVEVPAERIRTPQDLDALSGADLEALFRASGSAGFPRTYT